MKAANEIRIGPGWGEILVRLPLPLAEKWLMYESTSWGEHPLALDEEGCKRLDAAIAEAARVNDESGVTESTPSSTESRPIVARQGEVGLGSGPGSESPGPLFLRSSDPGGGAG